MKSLFKNPIFILGLLIRIALLPFPGSETFQKLFVPFLDYFVSNPIVNPWNIFLPHYFPYGSILLVLVAAPKALVSLLFPVATASSLNVVLYKLPILLIDILFFKILILISSERLKKKLLIFFWINPVLIYISYIHVQLDIFSIFFLILALNFHSKRSWSYSAIFFSLGILCKFHIVLALPLFLAFIWNKLFLKDSIKEVCSYLVKISTIVFIGFLPHVFAGKADQVTIISPQAKTLLSASISYGDHRVLFVGLLILMIGTVRVIFSTFISKTGLILGVGFLFNLLLISTSFAPGWFYWVIPFYALALALNHTIPKSLFHLFSFAFFIHFGLPELGIPGMRDFIFFDSLTFTFLIGMLCLFAFLIYWLFFNSNLSITRRTSPLMIGISGDSGSGKSFLSEIQSKLFPHRFKIVNGDDYHRWERNDPNWQYFTHLDPNSNHLSKMAEHTQGLIKGTSVYNHHYDHSTGKFTELQEIKPAQTLFLQGLHTFYLKGLREKIDLKIFCAPTQELKKFWKLKRDMLERGHTKEKVLNSMSKRQIDSLNHIAVQREYADWIIETYPTIELDIDMIGETNLNKEIELKYKHIFWNDVNVFELIEMLAPLLDDKSSLKIESVNSERIIVEFKGDIPKEIIEITASKLFPDLKSVTRSRYKPEWYGGHEGLIQLFTISLLLNHEAKND